MVAVLAMLLINPGQWNLFGIFALLALAAIIGFMPWRGTELQAMFQKKPSAPDNVPEQLEKLESLRKDGVLTPEEFEAQKRKLLS